MLLYDTLPVSCDGGYAKNGISSDCVNNLLLLLGVGCGDVPYLE